MKNHIKRFTATCFIMVIALHAAVAQEAQNLLKNGNLLQGKGREIPGWVFSKWNLTGDSEGQADWGLSIDSGKENSLRLAVLVPGKNINIWWVQEVPALGGATYVLRYRARGRAESPLNSSKWAGMSAGFEFFDASGKWLGFQNIQRSSVVEEWQTYEGKVTIPDDAAKIGVRISLQANVPSEAHFSDILLQMESSK